MKNELTTIYILIALGAFSDILGGISDIGRSKKIRYQQQQIETLTKKVDSLIIVQKIKR